MKIHTKGRPRQFSFTKVTCLDSLMAEMLNCAPDINGVVTVQHFVTLRETRSVNFVYTFFSGAMLKAGDATNQFFIYSHMSDGSDAMAAIEELKMLDALRIARRHFLEMKKICIAPGIESLSLRVTRF